MNNHNEYICVCIYTCTQGFPGGSDGKESACNARDLGLSPGLERSPREGNGYPLQYSIFFFFVPLQYSCLEISMDRRASQAKVHRVTKSQNC